jgi:hypothetical protein
LSLLGGKVFKASLVRSRSDSKMPRVRNRTHRSLEVSLTQDPARSPGVTVIAALSLLGSLLVLAMGALMVVVAILFTPPSQSDLAASPGLLKGLMALVSLFYTLPAIWGIATSVGLFRLKNWARISMIIFSIALICMAGFSGLITLVISFPAVAQAKIDPSFMVWVRVFMILFWGLQVAIGVWWLVFLTRPKVKQQFLTAYPSPTQLPCLPSQHPVATLQEQESASRAAGERPLSITIIALLTLFGSFSVTVALLLHQPAIFLTEVLTGSKATIYYVGILSLSLYAGIGLLRLQPKARLTAIGLLVFGFANSAAFYLAPGGQERFVKMIASQPSFLPTKQLETWYSTVDIRPLLIVGMVLGLFVIIVKLYFLFTRRAAFEKVQPTN